MSMNPLPAAGAGSDQAGGFPVKVTSQAINKIRAFAEGNPDFEGKAFRVVVSGGGCAGFRYGFVFDDANDGDVRTSIDGIDIAVDPQVMSYLQGSTVDYVESLEGAGFTVNNPNASKTCGCGSSFKVL